MSSPPHPLQLFSPHLLRLSFVMAPALGAATSITEAFPAPYILLLCAGSFQAASWHSLGFCLLRQLQSLLCCHDYRLNPAFTSYCRIFWGLPPSGFGGGTCHVGVCPPGGIHLTTQQWGVICLMHSMIFVLSSRIVALNLHSSWCTASGCWTFGWDHVGPCTIYISGGTCISHQAFRSVPSESIHPSITISWLLKVLLYRYAV